VNQTSTHLNAHASTSASPPGLTLLMPPILLVRQSLQAVKEAELEPEREGVWSVAPTLATAPAKAADTIDQSSDFAGEFVEDPDYDDGQSRPNDEDTGSNIPMDLTFRPRFEIDIR
jgi:hypothetical protein